MVRAATLVALLSASCVSTSSNVCEDGSLCPGGFQCDVENHRCLLPEQIAVCEGLDEGTPCSLSTGENGACRIGACMPYICGDGYVTPEIGEDCEPTQAPEEYSKDCIDFGTYGASGLTCTEQCTFFEGVKATESSPGTGCYANNEYCGDDILNGPELCEPPAARSCLSLGFDAGTTSCNDLCGFSIGECSRFGFSPESLGTLVALAVAGSGPSDVWAVGQDGKAMHFEGAFWNPVQTGVQNILSNAWAFASDDVWAVGMSDTPLPSVIIRWNGTVWAQVDGAPAGEYIDVWGPRVDEVYVASGVGVLKYDGAGWTTLPDLGGTPRAIRGSSGSDIWVSTSQGPLKHFNGTTWTDRSPPGAKIEFLDVNAPDDVWAIGMLTSNIGTGVIAHWNGSAWQQWITPQEHYVAVASSTSNDAWVAGVDDIMRHWDGTAWSRSLGIGASSSGITAMSGLISFGPDHMVAVSTLELAYRYRGQALGSFRALGTNPFDAPSNTAMWGPTDNKYVVNVAGEIWRWNGTQWTEVFTVPDVQLSDIAASGPTDIWVSGEDGNAYHFDGLAWTADSVDPATQLVRTWVAPTGEAWMFSSVIAYRRAGSEWVPSNLGPGRVASVSGTAANDIWLVQRTTNMGAGELWHYDGGGWTTVTTPAGPDVLAVAVVASNDVHVAATNGRFLRFDGTSWTESVVPVLQDVVAMEAGAPDDVVATNGREVFHFNGIAWAAIRTPVEIATITGDTIPFVDLDVQPSRIDMLLRTFNIRTLIRTRPLICRTRETCGDGVDNDCDDDLDDADSECP